MIPIRIEMQPGNVGAKEIHIVWDVPDDHYLWNTQSCEERNREYLLATAIIAQTMGTATYELTRLYAVKKVEILEWYFDATQVGWCQGAIEVNDYDGDYALGVVRKALTDAMDAVGRVLTPPEAQ